MRALRGAEPQNQLTEETPLYVFLLVLEGFVMVGAGVASFYVFVEFDPLERELVILDHLQKIGI